MFCVCVCFRSLSQSAITAGDFGLLISYALNVTQLLNISVILSSQVEAFMNSVERVQHYSVPRDQENWEAADKRLSESVQGENWPSKGRIQIKDLQMRYREDLDLVLKHINLDFPAGARVGVVGRTGSGQCFTRNTQSASYQVDYIHAHSLCFPLPSYCVFQARAHCW